MRKKMTDYLRLTENKNLFKEPDYKISDYPCYCCYAQCSDCQFSVKDEEYPSVSIRKSEPIGGSCHDLTPGVLREKLRYKGEPPHRSSDVEKINTFLIVDTYLMFVRRMKNGKTYTMAPKEYLSESRSFTNRRLVRCYEAPVKKKEVVIKNREDLEKLTAECLDFDTETVRRVLERVRKEGK